MACAICQKRRPRRFCPGVGGDICTLCCGTEREVTVACPLDCEFLALAHEHERIEPREPEPLINATVKINEEFLEEHEVLLVFVGSALGQAAEATEGAIDSDVRDALAGLAQTYLTLESGLLYEHVPTNPLAASISRQLQDEIIKFRELEPEEMEADPVSDSDILRVLVFFQRLELERSNGRRRGRAFIGMLRLFHQREAEIAKPSSLILP